MSGTQKKVIDLSIVIPCFNEEENIFLLLKEFEKITINNNFELILVDNGSVDKTWYFLKEAEKRYKFLKILKINNNIGYGHGIVSGLSVAKGKYIGWTHADLQTDICDILKAYTIINESKAPENIYVKGLRRNRRLYENIFSFGMSVFESLWLGVFLRDINAQPNLFPKNFFDYWIDPPNDFLLDLYSYALAKKCGYKIKRINVLFKKRIFGKSSWNINWKSKFKFSFRIFLDSIQIRNKFFNTIKIILLKK